LNFNLIQGKLAKSNLKQKAIALRLETKTKICIEFTNCDQWCKLHQWQIFKL